MTVTVLAVNEIPLSPELEAAWLADLPAQRRMRLLEWTDLKARCRSLLGARLLREGLMRLGYSNHSLSRLRYPLHGRPTVDLPVDFSLTHCEGRVLCALSTAGSVGVDVERAGSLTAGEFRRYLTPRERAWAGGDAGRFYVLWTRKEAVVKAAGVEGLQQLPDIEVIGAHVDFGGLRWFLSSLMPGAGYAAHLAARLPVQPEIEWVSELQLQDCC